VKYEHFVFTDNNNGIEDVANSEELDVQPANEHPNLECTNEMGPRKAGKFEHKKCH
jgi:hypothetical protein